MLVLLDMAIVDRPCKLGHFWLPIAATSGYAVFTVVYDLGFDGVNMLGEPYLYEALDYSENFQGAALVALSTITLSGLVHGLRWFLVRSSRK